MILKFFFQNVGIILKHFCTKFDLSNSTPAKKLAVNRVNALIFERIILTILAPNIQCNLNCIPESLINCHSWMRVHQPVEKTHVLQGLTLQMLADIKDAHLARLHFMSEYKALFPQLHSIRVIIFPPKSSGAVNTPNSINLNGSQGSILGPILFNIFINDLFHFVDGENFHIFADDNTLSEQADRIEELAENLPYLSEVAIDWMDQNTMIAIPSKCQAILLSKNCTLTDRRPIKIKENQIESET